MKLLVADDDPQIVRALQVTLRAQGYDILTAADGGEALNRAVEHRPDLYLLDLGMPNFDGLQVIQAIRGWSAAPILVISGRTESTDKVEALDAGADDYLTKPFAIDELLARIRALSRRTVTVDAAPVVQLGEVTIDLSARGATRRTAGGEAKIRLTPTEWRVLETLLKNPGRLVTRRTLLTEIWGAGHTTDTGYLRLYLSQLRKKLEADPAHPRYLVTEPGMGYRYEP